MHIGTNSARWLTSGGLAAMIFGYFLLPWGDGETFFLLRGEVFAERWEGADFNRRLQEAFGSWGFLLLIALGIAAAVLVRRASPRPLMIGLGVLLLGGVAWHQGMIGTVNGLNLVSHLPQVGAVASALGLWNGRDDGPLYRAAAA